MGTIRESRCYDSRASNVLPGVPNRQESKSNKLLHNYLFCTQTSFQAALSLLL